MNSDRKPNPQTREQVDAFLEHLYERLDLDEEKIKRVANTNGKHVTWMWVIGVLLAVVAFLGGRMIVASQASIDRLEARQADVRERLLSLELLVRQIHSKERP